MVDFSITDIDKCANNSCPNRADQGRFVVVESKEMIVGGHRGIHLIMCASCAAALAGKVDIRVGGYKSSDRAI